MARKDIDALALEARGSEDALAVKSALKWTLERELVSTLSSGIAAADTPQHLASPGPLRPR